MEPEAHGRRGGRQRVLLRAGLRELAHQIDRRAAAAAGRRPECDRQSSPAGRAEPALRPRNDRNACPRHPNLAGRAAHLNASLVSASYLNAILSDELIVTAIALSGALSGFVKPG